MEERVKREMLIFRGGQARIHVAMFYKTIKLNLHVSTAGCFQYTWSSRSLSRVLVVETVETLSRGAVEVEPPVADKVLLIYSEF